MDAQPQQLPVWLCVMHHGANRSKQARGTDSASETATHTVPRDGTRRGGSLHRIALHCIPQIVSAKPPATHSNTTDVTKRSLYSVIQTKRPDRKKT